MKCFEYQFLLVALHFPSKLNAGENELRPIANRMVRDIEQAEERVGHKNTLIIGDFNANQFEDVCINADCLHAVPDALIANKKERIVHYNKYQMFYNPMWNFFGDYKVPHGTYYNVSTGIKTYFWNIFDQVLFRTDMIKTFEKESLKIITEVTGHSLLNEKGIPDKDMYSDHLPIFFKIKEEKLG